MFRVKSLFAAVAVMISAPLALTPIASAQSTVVVIDRIQIFGQRLAGQDIRTKIQGIETTMQGELQPVAQQLSTEGTALETKTQGMSREAILADAGLRTEVEAYARKAGEFNRDRQIASQELALTERKALIDFNTALVPVLREVVAENSANVILDKSQVVFVDDATDVTASVITKLNASTPSIADVRQKLPPQQPQQ